jgi:5-(carboxyamino)imidazole ribonucleotide synthase
MIGDESHVTISPGGTIGILGSGQLGRMLALAARQMGYGVRVFSPERRSPAGQVADLEVSAAYDDLDAVRTFARQVDVITFEFENVPAATAAAAAECAPVRPDGRVLHTTQNRRREKSFLAQAGLPVTPFVPVDNLSELEAGLARLGCPAILKTAAFGYDGKGQVRIDSPGAAPRAWQAIGGRKAVLEAFVPFEQELSVVAARGQDGSQAHYGLIKNSHHNHILDVSLMPAALSPAVAASAVDLAQAVLETLDVVGVLCVEFFLASDGRLLINELAPRPHNSGHLTIDACPTSQFEQQLRAVCGLPLGSTRQVQPAAMANLLGDLWQSGPPNWAAACAFPGVNLHLYGKLEARPGRKMGHLTAVAGSVAEAERLALAAREAVSRQPTADSRRLTLKAES